MKKQIFILTALLITSLTFSQNRELREASRALDNSAYVEAKNALAKIEGNISSANTSQQAEFYLYKGLANLGTAENNEKDIKTAAESFKKVLEIEGNRNGKFSPSAQSGIDNLRVMLVNAAISDQDVEDFGAASKKLYLSYTISPRDTSDLYFAAGNAYNAKDYDTAIKYYEKLIEMGYTGIQTEYTAVEKATGNVESFRSKDIRDGLLRTGEYVKPGIKTSESRRGELMRNIAFLYIEQGQDDKAKRLIKVARAESPNDMSLVQAEANIALKLEDYTTYRQLIEQIVASDPNNPELYYNLGVSSAAIGDRENAEKYYKKALQLDPDYALAHLNLAAMMLEEENDIIEEMNSLGMSAADNKRYEELKTKRENLFSNAVPHLEKALVARPNDISIMRTLMNIYSIKGDESKSKAMQARIQASEN